MKDKVASSLAQRFINPRITRYGEVQSLQLDSKHSGAEVVVQLLGEAAPLRIVINRYTLRQENGRASIRIEAVLCERTWVENALQDFVCGRWYEIPGWVSLAL